MRKRGRPTSTSKVITKKRKGLENGKKNLSTDDQPATSRRVINNRNVATLQSKMNEKNKLPKPPPMYKISTKLFELKPTIVNHTILVDIHGKQWRLGGPIGKGSFGEIFLVSNKIDQPVTKHNTMLVSKFEPHVNGPLFVEMHFFLNTQKNRVHVDDFNEPLSTAPNGIPGFITTGSHYFGAARYRFIIQQRFNFDLYSLVYDRCMQPHHILTVGNLLMDAVQTVHERGYVHNDIKAANIMISKVRYFEENQLIGHVRRRRRKRRAFRLNYRKHFTSRRISECHPESSEVPNFSLENQQNIKRKIIEEERIFLIDFGLATKYTDNGLHRSFIMDYKRAHDGTLEFTSRDAHCGAHSRRSDMECIGFNLLLWSQGYLPWEDESEKCKLDEVHRAKEYFMTDPRNLLRSNYGPHVPDFIGEYLSIVGKLAFNERPDYARYKNLFKQAFKKMGLAANSMKVDSDAILRSSFYITAKPKIKNKMYRSCDVKKYKRIPRRKFSALPKTVRELEILKFNLLAFDPMDVIFLRYEEELSKMRKIGKFKESIERKYEGKPTYAILAAEVNLKDKAKRLCRQSSSSLRSYQNPIYRTYSKNNKFSKNLMMAKKISMLHNRKPKRAARKSKRIKKTGKNYKTDDAYDAEENETRVQNNVQNLKLKSTIKVESEEEFVSKDAIVQQSIDSVTSDIGGNESTEDGMYSNFENSNQDVN